LFYAFYIISAKTDYFAEMRRRIEGG